MTDPSGAAVQGATVSARNIDTNVSSAMPTDADGRFRFPYLKVGPYEVVVRRNGFADRAQKLTLTIGSAFDLAIHLSLASTQTSVNVVEDAAVLESGAVSDRWDCDANRDR